MSWVAIVDFISSIICKGGWGSSDESKCGSFGFSSDVHEFESNWRQSFLFISHFFKSIENLLILTIEEMLAHLSHILLETEHHQTRMTRYLVLTSV